MANGIIDANTDTKFFRGDIMQVISAKGWGVGTILRPDAKDLATELLSKKTKEVVHPAEKPFEIRLVAILPADPGRGRDITLVRAEWPRGSGHIETINLTAERGMRSSVAKPYTTNGRSHGTTRIQTHGGLQ